MIWIFDLSAGSGNLQSFSLYGVTFFSVDFLLSVRDMLIGRFDRNFLTLLRLCEMLMASFLSVPQCLPCVFRLFSSLGCYLRSIPLLCVCWSRLICTFLVEVVRVIPFQHFFLFKCSFWNLFIISPGVFSASVSTATTSPLSSLYSLMRSMLVAALLYGFCLGAISVSEMLSLNVQGFECISGHNSCRLILYLYDVIFCH